jgi:hypothetical protein
MRVNWHKEPNDKEFNTVEVLKRDRRAFIDEGKHYYRPKCLVPLSGSGHHLGFLFSPREGNMVMVWFYQERKGIVLFTIPHWFEKPICRPTPYDIAIKYGQHRRPKRYQPTGDFLFKYPEPKKPFCFRWWHGEKAYKKGDIDEGRDWCFLFDYCREGDACPDCRLCQTIDSIGHILNHYFKFYSEQTESRKAYPLRGVYHNPSGSYWLFEGSNKPSDEYVSEFYTEGMGFWTLQGSVIQDGIEYYKGHVRHHPDGSTEMHSATPDPDNSAGSWCFVLSDDNQTADDYGLIAYDLEHLITGCKVRGYKNGALRCRAQSAIDQASSEVFLEPDGHCWLWNIKDDTYIEFFTDGSGKIKASPLTIEGDTVITGSLTHGNGPCCNPATQWV